MNSMKRQNDRILKEELPRSVGAQYATGDQWRNNSRKNEGMEPKQKQYPVVDVTGDRSKVWFCKEQYCIGTWNVRSTNQGKLEVVKQEMARVNTDILGISELRWTGMGEFRGNTFHISLSSCTRCLCAQTKPTKPNQTKPELRQPEVTLQIKQKAKVCLEIKSQVASAPKRWQNEAQKSKAKWHKCQTWLPSPTRPVTWQSLC